VLSGSGGIDPLHPGLFERTLILTSERCAARLGDVVPASATVIGIGDTPQLEPAAAIDVLRTRGHELILCEGGPTLFSALVGAGVVDELFLTLSPLLAGRPDAERRLALLEGGKPLPSRTVACNLLTLRRAGSHLFLRYELRQRGAAADAMEVSP
jgi:riboflavin biosynthesis pyrimidine reductase